MNKLIRLCRKAANEWRNTDTYHQASVLIDSLCDRLEKYEPRKPKTNADRIRAMSDEELAKKIPCPYIKNEYDECKFGWHERTQTCEECALEWLRKTASN